MKKSHTLRALMLLSLPFASQAFGQAPPPPPIPGTVAKVTLSLTVTDEIEGTVAKDANGKPLKKGTEGAGPAFENTYDISKKEVKIAKIEEYISKTKTRKYSNKELLTDLVELGFLPGPDIKGWSIVRVAGTYVDEESIIVDETPEPTVEVPEPEQVLTEYDYGVSVWEGDDGFFAVHKEKGEVNISEYFDAYWYSGVSAEDWVLDTPYDEEGELDYPATTRMYSSKFKSQAYAYVDLDKSYPAVGEVPAYTIWEEYGDNLYGLATGSEESGFLKDKTTPVWLPGAVKLDPLMGTYYYSDSRDEDSTIYSIIDGTLSIAKGTVIPDVTADFFPEEVD